MKDKKVEIKKFKELSNVELYNILKLRSEVFVVEQQCIYNDIDGLDVECFHAILKDGENIAGYLRILLKEMTFETMSIGRVLVNKDYRNLGVARKLMLSAIDYIFVELKEKEITISAQKYLVEFYKSLGFKELSDMYMEDGIPHIDMKLDRK
ncbi:MAG: GNAT family N-acetyltransferase [Firmicutes bacterium]|jgi:ElaA protein|nr:GNAT family N-acetyltransferase [Bacillota bacterium]